MEFIFIERDELEKKKGTETIAAAFRVCLTGKQEFENFHGTLAHCCSELN